MTELRSQSSCKSGNMAENRSDSPLDPALEVAQLIDRLERDVVGQRSLLERMVVALLAGGHVLIEGVPGLAKTRAVRSIALALDLSFQRVQFTPDLLPADLTGTQVYRPSTGTFDVRPGPIVASVVLADEINRAPAKVQSALLEAMQEGQITIGDRTIVLPDPFWVLATQNPVDQEGTYPLPEAQLDRFLMKLRVGYPDRGSELAMLELTGLPRDSEPKPSTIWGPDDVRRLRAASTSVRVAAPVKEYAIDVVRATRDPAAAGLSKLAAMIERGASPRASLGLVASARAHALMSGRRFATPHDVKSLARDILRHRVVPSYEADAEGLGPDDLISQILDHVPVP